MSGASLWAVLALVTVACCTVWGLVRLGYRQGRADHRHEEDEKRENMVIRAAALRDRLRRDAAFADRVRARFTR